MKILTGFLVFLVSSTLLANEVELEKFSQNVISSLQMKSKSFQYLLVNSVSDCAKDTLCEEKRSVLINTLMALTDDERKVYHDELLSLAESMNVRGATPAEKLKILALHRKLAVDMDPLNVPNIEIEILHLLQSKSLDLASIHTLCGFNEELGAKDNPQIESFVHHHNCESRLKSHTPTPEMINDLFYKTPNGETYKNGKYANQVKLFMFCRHTRHHPCLFVLKDKDGKPVRKSSGELWSQPSLGMSSRGIPYNKTNGDTPAGIHEMNGVMPYADQQGAFGKYRRVILNFITRSTDEENHINLLPASSHNHNWWHEAMIARDVGRDLLRIHGTGRRLTNSSQPYYPFTPTAGCIAQRENYHSGITYHDQRKILDQLMLGLDLPAQYSNEANISGLLYVIEIDDKRRSVSLQDLKDLGIQ